MPRLNQPQVLDARGSAPGRRTGAATACLHLPRRSLLMDCLHVPLVEWWLWAQGLWPHCVTEGRWTA